MPTLEIAQKKLDGKKSRRTPQCPFCTNIQLSGITWKWFPLRLSNQGKEGKSTTSTNIAWAFARAGYKHAVDWCGLSAIQSCQVSLNHGKDYRPNRVLCQAQQTYHKVYAKTNVENLFVIQGFCIKPNNSFVTKWKFCDHDWHLT